MDTKYPHEKKNIIYQKTMILKSASRFVFVIMSLALCAFTFLWIVEAKDFVALITGIFGYYFGRNQNSSLQSQENK